MQQSIELTQRQRFLAVLEGRTPDRLAWFPRLEIWHEANRLEGSLPERYRDVPLAEIYRRLGMGRQGRDARKRAFYRSELRGVEVRVERSENELRTEYLTPVGRVSTLERSAEELRRKGIMGLEVEHLIKGPDDYAPVEYMLTHTDILPAYENYLAYEAEIGEEGIVFPYIGQDPMNRILQELIGYNAAYFHLADYPEKVDHLYQVLDEHYQEIQKVTLASPAGLILHGQHFDSMMTPVRIFKKYMLPYYQAFAEQLHARGKFLACHADADSSKLLQLMVESGFDLVDCFVTAPMVPVTIEQARATFTDQVIIWGGIPSVLLESTTSDEEFDRYLGQLFETIAPGNHFILGVADNVMPSSKIERVERIQAMIQNFSWSTYGPHQLN